VDGAVLGEEAFVLRYFGGRDGDRLLMVNLGRDLSLDAAPEPLLAPVEGRPWVLQWSSEDPRYGGCGTAPLDGRVGWRIPGNAAIVMRSAEANPVWQD
jgi:maltooligosyltrehalose trehalohydrolase